MFTITLCHAGQFPYYRFKRVSTIKAAANKNDDAEPSELNQVRHGNGFVL
jgi:hypothetical protein